MCIDISGLGYIDPNTSQHVFSLLGPILTFLATAGGLLVAGLVIIRHRITAYFRTASWTRRVAAVSLVLGVSTIVAAVIWWLVR